MVISAYLLWFSLGANQFFIDHRFVLLQGFRNRPELFCNLSVLALIGQCFRPVHGQVEM